MDLRLRNLMERSKRRDEAIWKTFDLLGLGLSEYELLDNQTYADETAQFLAVLDAEIDAAVANRNLLHEADLYEVDQDKKNALARIVAQRQALAIKTAGDLLVLAAKEYDAKVKALIMAAKEYAAEVEKEQIKLERERAEQEYRKAELQIEDVNARIFFEMVERKQLEAEQAKTQVEVARANIKVLMAEIEAQEAELKIIQEELEEAMTEAEKATLNSDIAMIIADITTRCLAGIRLGVEEAEIAETRQYIQQHLDDVLKQWESRTLEQHIRQDAEARIQAEIWRHLEKQKEEEDLKVLNANDDLAVTRKDIDITLNKSKVEGYEKYKIGIAKAIVVAAKARASIEATQAKEEARIAESQAYEQVYQNSEHYNETVATIEQTIYG
jgi:hypothetical protein